MLPVSMTSHLATAQANIDAVMAQGSTVMLVKAGTKDKGGHITSEATLNITCFPVRFRPFEKQILQQVSFAENSDILLWTAAKGKDVDALRQYEKIRYNGIDYKINETPLLYGAHANTHLYIIIGGSK